MAWRRQARTIYSSKHPWGEVAGPTVATLLAHRSLQWVSSSAFAVRTDRGDALDLREASPLAVRDIARESAVRRLWSDWAGRRERDTTCSLAPKTSSGYWLEPV
eukprot:7021597-Pyramimonas_sp.AAC.1